MEEVKQCGSGSEKRDSIRQTQLSEVLLDAATKWCFINWTEFTKLWCPSRWNWCLFNASVSLDWDLSPSFLLPLPVDLKYMVDVSRCRCFQNFACLVTLFSGTEFALLLRSSCSLKSWSLRPSNRLSLKKYHLLKLFFTAGCHDDY